MDVSQTTPLAVTRAPPSDVTSPPSAAVVAVMLVTGESVVTVGATTAEITVKEETGRVLLGPNPSVTIIVQLEYVPTGSELKVIVLLPAVALVVPELHE